MADLYDKVEIALDTDPLKLRDALHGVLALCRYVDELPDSQRREWSAPTTMAIRRTIADALEVDCG